MLKLILAVLVLSPQLAHAQKLEQIIAEAKKEGEVTLVASASTFGGKKGFAELEALFAKRYGFKAKLNLVAGRAFRRWRRGSSPSKRPARSRPRIFISARTAPTSTMHQEKALERVNWSGTFPWVTKEMEIFPQESVLVYASFHGIIYNSNSIPKDKAPKSYDDLIDPALSPTWAGKMAMPAYIHWLIRVSPMWGKEKVLSLRAQTRAARRRPAAPGRRRAHRQRRVPDHGEHRRPLEAMWKWQAKGAPLVGLPGSSPASSSYYQLGVPKNSVHPNMAKLFAAFMSTREAQSVLEKQDYRSSHLVDGTL